MVENPNGRVDSLSIKAQRAFEIARRKAGSVFVNTLQDPSADRYYAYFNFCRRRAEIVTGSTTISSADVSIIRGLTRTELSRMAAYQQSANPDRKIEGIRMIEAEAERIAQSLKPKKRATVTPILN